MSENREKRVNARDRILAQIPEELRHTSESIDTWKQDLEEQKEMAELDAKLAKMKYMQSIEAEETMGGPMETMGGPMETMGGPMGMGSQYIQGGYPGQFNPMNQPINNINGPYIQPINSMNGPINSMNGPINSMNGPINSMNGPINSMNGPYIQPNQAYNPTPQQYNQSNQQSVYTNQQYGQINNNIPNNNIPNNNIPNMYARQPINSNFSNPLEMYHTSPYEETPPTIHPNISQQSIQLTQEQAESLYMEAQQRENNSSIHSGDNKSLGARLMHSRIMEDTETEDTLREKEKAELLKNNSGVESGVIHSGSNIKDYHQRVKDFMYTVKDQLADDKEEQEILDRQESSESKYKSDDINETTVDRFMNTFSVIGEKIGLNKSVTQSSIGKYVNRKYGKYKPTDIQSLSPKDKTELLIEHGGKVGEWRVNANLGSSEKNTIGYTNEINGWKVYLIDSRGISNEWYFSNRRKAINKMREYIIVFCSGKNIVEINE